MDTKNKFYEIKVDHAFKEEINNEGRQVLMISHNDHIGHFLLDDFPLISLVDGPLNCLLQSGPTETAINHKKSILRF